MHNEIAILVAKLQELDETILDRLIRIEKTRQEIVANAMILYETGKMTTQEFIALLRRL